MIDIKELRIGSWVHYKNPLYKKGFYKVWGINNNSIPRGENITVDLDSQSLDTHVHRASLKDILPIPLKEEILLKCGFYQENGVMSYVTQDYSDIKITYETLAKYYRLYPYTYRIDYLHQLQNLYFDLTGEELEVKL